METIELLGVIILGLVFFLAEEVPAAYRGVTSQTLFRVAMPEPDS